MSLQVGNGRHIITRPPDHYDSAVKDVWNMVDLLLMEDVDECRQHTAWSTIMAIYDNCYNSINEERSTLSDPEIMTPELTRLRRIFNLIMEILCVEYPPIMQQIQNEACFPNKIPVRITIKNFLDSDDTDDDSEPENPENEPIRGTNEESTVEPEPEPEPENTEATSGENLDST